jgi:DNA repair protein RadC
MYLYKDGQKAYVEKEQVEIMLESGWVKEGDVVEVADEVITESDEVIEDEVTDEPVETQPKAAGKKTIKKLSK